MTPDRRHPLTQCSPSGVEKLKIFKEKVFGRVASPRNFDPTVNVEIENRKEETEKRYEEWTMYMKSTIYVIGLSWIVAHAITVALLIDRRTVYYS